MTTAQKILRSVATVAAVVALMAFGTWGQFTAENAGFPQTMLVDG